uniref:Uncharacterized protein n=1 Tax=Arundo donax TaxID=35708 RepID=A0A0A9ET25_ARUDO
MLSRHSFFSSCLLSETGSSAVFENHNCYIYSVPNNHNHNRMMAIIERCTDDMCIKSSSLSCSVVFS